MNPEHVLASVAAHRDEALGKGAQVFTIQASRLESLSSELDKLIKKGAKAGLTLSYSFGIPYQAEVEQTIAHEVFRDGCAMVKEVQKTTEYTAVNVAVFGATTIVHEGYEFVARLDHESGETIVNAIGDKVCPKEYRAHERSGVCDHCGIDRRRKSTFIVRHTATNAYKQVGSSCLAEFLGGLSAEKAIAQAMIALFISLLAKEAREASTGGSNYVSLQGFLLSIAKIIRVYGWVPKASEYAKPTMARYYNDEHKKIDGSAEDVATVSATLAWAVSLSDEVVERSDYLYNLRTITRNNILTRRNEGFAASMIAARTRDEQQKQERAIAIPSTHLGIIGEKLVAQVTLRVHNQFDNQYGVTHQYVFQAGNDTIVWFASSNQGLLAGDSYTLVGSVKAHNEYKGKLQTVVTRCKVLPPNEVKAKKPSKAKGSKNNPIDHVEGS